MTYPFASWFILGIVLGIALNAFMEARAKTKIITDDMVHAAIVELWVSGVQNVKDIHDNEMRKIIAAAISNRRRVQ